MIEYYKKLISDDDRDTNKYVVTGIDRRGKRFSHRYSNFFQAMGINLWNGSVWEVNPQGKRKLLKRVHN